MNWKTTATAVGLALMASTGLARAEGALNIYNWGNYISPDMIKKFEKQYNVKVTVTDYDSNDTALAKVRQGGTGFDIAIPSQTFIPIWIKEGLIQETDPGKMANFKNVAPEWANPDFDPGRKYTVPWAWGTIGVVVNTDAYKGPANSWGIVFNTPDELKGKVNVVPEMNDVIFAAIKYVGGKQCTDDKAVLKKVRDTLVAAKPNWIAMEYNTIEKMGAGDFKATSDWNGSALRQRLANPAIHYNYPKEGYGLWSDNVVVLKEAKNVENAKLFQNFMMDPENAALNSAFHRYANGIAGSEKFMPADMKDAPEVNIPADVKSLGELQHLCAPEIQDIYSKIWTELQK
ncbi:MULTISPECIES: extracellular solute-binding protein [Phyllobacteriaceae]|jgi:spermidine/putrescine transport system substrate-binding protein|uniref:Putrescine-binding periplasmic protein n=1 Tax=Mesorhizobium hungaricum TaxID=1566387 RepID=A0A1C2EAA8_9HYPH|nr:MULTISPECIES: extracellular solute-binding protein [Mesorhizobium]MBN9237115.1 extracellular solute-binding protein [Mesorhizobium sp.]MDQ0329319.1 spermidine/putrescine transport system substrate-binding protein [Mesorhizobium sp. YL-MeA3-2017]OCX23923.1 putrescine/spermidine ABC transporter substrate-binding protein [Mesorhizobium hungaricum]